MTSMPDPHDCNPIEHAEGWGGWDCPVCDTHWFLDLSYEGPGYRHQVYTWVRDD